MRRRRAAVLASAASFALAIVGCEQVRDALDGAHRRDTAAVETLRAPAGPDAPDLDLHHEWRAARVHQQVAERHRDWAYRPFTEYVVLNGVGHRTLLLLPSQHGEATRASFKVEIPADSDAELVAWVALFPKFAPDSDGVEVAWTVAAGDANPEDVPLEFERLAGGAAPADWREVRVDLAPWRGRTVWVVLASRDPGGRHSDWLLWGDPRIRAKRPAAPVVVDLASPATSLVRRPRAAPWSAATVFKTYSLFGADGPHYGPPEWLRAAYPWIESLRFLSAIGGNYGPTLARLDAEAAAKGDPKNFEVGVSDRYEFFREEPGTPSGALGEQRGALGEPRGAIGAPQGAIGAPQGAIGAPQGAMKDRFDWREFDALNASAASSGARLLLNLAGAPERFTGGTGDYATYRFNELAVVDEPAWREYVAATFAHLAQQPWFDRASFSFFSEPNCVWVEADGRVRKVGFQGDAAQYARQYLATWQSMAPHVGTAPIRLGPFVVETARSSAAADNLAEYLGAMKDAFASASTPLPPWSAFSFNLYETPHLGLDNFTSDKIVHAREVLTAVLGRADLPLAIEELGVHPIVMEAFQGATGVQLGTTRWEQAWHAEMAALLLQENIVEAASWYPILMVYPPKQSLRAYASYLFASIVAGTVEWTARDDGTLTVARATGGMPAGDVGVRLASRHTDRVGVLAAADGARHRLAVWSYPRFLATDARVATGAAPERVELVLPARAEGSWRVRILGYDDETPLASDDGVGRRTLAFPTFAGLPAFALRELEARDRLTLTVDPGAVYLIELQ